MEDEQKKPTMTVIDAVYLRNLMSGNQECVYFLHSSRFSDAMKEAAISTHATILYHVTSNQAVEELRRLLALKIHFHDDDGRYLSPTPLMDIMWHALILDTRLDLQFQATLPFYVHHRPRGEADGERLTRLGRLSLYCREIFGSDPLDAKDAPIKVDDEELEGQQTHYEKYPKGITEEAEENVERHLEVEDEESEDETSEDVESEDEKLKNDKFERQQVGDEKYSEEITKEAKEDVERHPKVEVRELERQHEVDNEDVRKKAAQDTENPKDIILKIITPQWYSQQDTIDVKLRDRTRFRRVFNALKYEVLPPEGQYCTGNFAMFFEAMRLSGDDVPRQIGMKDGDCVELYFDRIRC
ncbi:hypothetical protein HYFRA_00005364 [Hymenoscyphus fraxineus]|uniref:Rad60/SUMO-like domain-containing protein n=1 Tax=Hymenoscyphus fraxineus TaxID=746836 RepID=A0A9N9LA88_9HELO|nr:hypothetical protein HYFRA_00005364 [Hymenoscyphus fraxineus]